MPVITTEGTVLCWLPNSPVVAKWRLIPMARFQRHPQTMFAPSPSGEIYRCRGAVRAGHSPVGRQL